MRAAKTLALVTALALCHNAHSQGLKALILTSPGIYHNYEYQNQVIADAMASRLNIAFDVSLEELERWETSDFGQDYDLLVYNICLADNENTALMANLRRQTEVLGVPAMVLHCTMHSFRNTDDWWPMYGLQTKAHEALGPMTVGPAAAHPILVGLTDDWSLPSDELYINLQTQGLMSLQTAMGKDSQPHVVTWLKQTPGAEVFGTTLGHANATLEDPAYQQLVSQAALYLTGHLNAEGQASPDLAPTDTGAPAIRKFSAAPGVRYLGRDGMDCAMGEMAWAVGPCMALCYLNPLVWGEEADDCRHQCLNELPTNQELVQACR